MTLSHSREPAAVWSQKNDQVPGPARHDGAFRRLEGVPSVNRIDNVKTAISRCEGAWVTIHPTYRAYADAVGFQPFTRQEAGLLFRVVSYRLRPLEKLVE